MPFIVVFLLAFGLSLLLTPLTRQWGLRLGLADAPAPRRVHTGTLSRLGGVALYLAFTLTVLATLAFPAFFPASHDPNEATRLIGLLVGGAVVVLFGLLDDRLQLPAWPQALVQVVAGLIGIASLIFIKHVNNPFTNQPFGGADGFAWPIVWLLTLFWFAGMMNTVNWLDGLDGLAAGVAAIFCLVVAGHMLLRAEPPQTSVALLPLALLGAVLGFLPYNFNPSSVIMGSSGAFFLGFVLAALGIMGGARVATVLLVLGLPILDVAWLIWRRVRSGRSPYHSSRDHLHHRLLDLGFSQRQIVLAYYAFCALPGGLAIFINSRLTKLLALGILGLLALAVLWWAAAARPDSAPGSYTDTKTQR